MLDFVKTCLVNKCFLDPGRPVLVAVSGGPDSLCLLDILGQLGYPLVVAHLDHALRPESAAEAQTVEAAAKRMGFPFVLGRVDVGAYSQAERLSLEEAARSARYRFLFEQAGLHGAQAVAVGHTADDQVETVLMHLLRGAGLSGLAGMDFRSLPNAWSQEMPLVRPLLGVWRTEIDAYLAERGLQPSLDASNLDRRFYRNRLRHELIPYLESYNPQVRSLVWRMAEVLRQENSLLDELASLAWEACLVEQGAGYLALDARRLKEQPLAIQRRLLRRGIACLRPGLRNVDFADVERALEFLDAPPRSGQADLAAGLRLLWDEDRLWLADWKADLPAGPWLQLPSDADLTLEVPGVLELPGGWNLTAGQVTDVEAAFAQATHNEDPYQAWLDLDRLSLPLHVRSRRPGDRFRPLGMGGHSLKLSDLMINLELPRRARDRWPLMISGDEIVWVPGVRLGDSASVSKETQRVVYIRLLKE